MNGVLSVTNITVTAAGPLCPAKTSLPGVVCAIQMHEIRHPVPFDRVTGAMRAEHRIRGVFEIVSRIVSRLFDDLGRIVAWPVAVEHAPQMAVPWV